MGFQTISARELNLCVRDGRRIIIDLRSPQEYGACHIRGAVNLPYEELEQMLSAAGKSGRTAVYEALSRRGFPTGNLLKQELVLYCERGATSMAAARELAELGFRVKSVVGGIRAYRGPYLAGTDRRLR